MQSPNETQPDDEEARKKQKQEQTASLLGIIGQRHKVRENLVKEGRLAEVLCADAALDEKVSDVEDIVQASLLKSGVSEPIAELTRTLVSGLGRMLLGLGPSQHDMIETSRKLFGVERTPEEKAANQARLMEKLERLKVKQEDKSPQEQPCRDTCPWCGGPADESCCDGRAGGLDGECPGAILRCRSLSCRWVCHCSTLAVEYSGRDAEGRDEVERCAPSNCDQRGTVQECASGWKCWGCGRLQEVRARTRSSLARGMYQAYAAELGWRRPFDNECLRRWSVHDVIAEGEPLIFGGAKAYAMDDGSSAGETERNAWCRLIFEVRESIGRRTMEEWAMLLYVVYADYLGGVSTYAPHEPLAPWGDIHDLERRGWLKAALYATDHIGCSCHP